MELSKILMQPLRMSKEGFLSELDTIFFFSMQAVGFKCIQHLLLVIKCSSCGIIFLDIRLPLSGRQHMLKGKKI